MTVKIIKSSDHIAVSAPWHPEFVERCHVMRARWDADNQAWIFPAAIIDDVRDALLGIYGQDDRPTPTATVTIDVTKDLYADLTAVAQRCVANDIRGKMGGRIKPESVHKILTRCIYCGYYTWHCEPIYKSDTEPIIDISTYNTVQQILLMRGIRLGRRRTKKIHFLPED